MSVRVAIETSLPLTAHRMRVHPMPHPLNGMLVHCIIENAFHNSLHINTQRCYIGPPNSCNATWRSHSHRKWGDYNEQTPRIEESGEIAEGVAIQMGELGCFGGKEKCAWLQHTSIVASSTLVANAGLLVSYKFVCVVTLVVIPI